VFKAKQKPLFTYAGDEALQAQLKALELDWTPEKLKERIREVVQGTEVVSPSQLMSEIAGAKMEEENIGDAETAQAFAFNFLSLWNEELAKRPPGEETDAWRAELQERVNAEAKEAQKPYIAEKKPGRNEPCFCGSGKKYKRCHGAG
jgi:uncharacterized protein YchJ